MTTYSIEVLGGVDLEKFNRFAGQFPIEIISASLLWAVNPNQMDKLALLTRDIPEENLPRIIRNIKGIPGWGKRKIVVYEVKEERSELYLRYLRRTNHR